MESPGRADGGARIQASRLQQRCLPRQLYDISDPMRQCHPRLSLDYHTTWLRYLSGLFTAVVKP